MTLQTIAASVIAQVALGIWDRIQDNRIKAKQAKAESLARRSYQAQQSADDLHDKVTVKRHKRRIQRGQGV